MKKEYFTIGLVTFLFIVMINCSKKMSEEDSIFSVDTSHSLPLEHSFGVGDNFASRGNIMFRGSKVGYASFSNDIELTNDEVNKLQRLVADNGLYFIRSPTKIGDTVPTEESNSNKTKYVQTFVKACYLYGSRLQEVITVSVDYSGNIIGLNIVSPRSPCSTGTHYMNTPTVFNSSVIVQQQVAGAVPDSQTFAKKLQQDAADEKAGKGKDNRSFLAKYWMYILPVFLILMLSAQAEQPAEGGGGE